MLEAARCNLKGLPVRLEILDGQALPYPDNRFDAVICQLGLMFFNDPGRGLSEFHRVLRNGRWAAVSVTTTAERSLFARIGAVIARHAPERAEKLNRFFSIPTVERLRSLIGGAGFQEVEIQTESRGSSSHRSTSTSAELKGGNAERSRVRSTVAERAAPRT
jgi:ubiquinone/menaquinone biosynthesis C-methylase UbiE